MCDCKQSEQLLLYLYNKRYRSLLVTCPTNCGPVKEEKLNRGKPILETYNNCHMAPSAHNWNITWKQHDYINAHLNFQSRNAFLLLLYRTKIYI